MSNSTLAFFKRKYEKRFKYLSPDESISYTSEKGERRRIKNPAAQEILQNARKKLKTSNDSRASLTTKEKKDAYKRLKRYTGGETPLERTQTRGSSIDGLTRRQRFKLNNSVKAESSLVSTRRIPTLKEVFGNSKKVPLKSRGALVTTVKVSPKKQISKLFKRGILGATILGTLGASAYGLNRLRKSRKDRGLKRGKYSKSKI